MAPAVVPRQRGRTRSPARTIHCSYAWNFAPYYLYLPSFSYFMLFFFLYSFIFFDAPYVRSRATHAHTTYIYMYISIYRYIIITWLYPLSRLIHLFENSFWSSVEKETDGARRRLACLSLFYYFFFFYSSFKIRYQQPIVDGNSNSNSNSNSSRKEKRIFQFRYIAYCQLLSFAKIHF